MRRQFYSQRADFGPGQLYAVFMAHQFSRCGCKEQNPGPKKEYFIRDPKDAEADTKPPGVILLKLIICENHVELNTSTTSIKTKLSKLDECSGVTKRDRRVHGKITK